MELKNRKIMNEYRMYRDDYVRIGDIVHNRLREITADSGIWIMAIEHRVKAEESLETKLETWSESYPSIDAVTDILGARVICYFADDVDRIGKLVENAFKIDYNKSKDKRKLISADSFGYLSVHYICSLLPSDAYPESFCKRRFEIQIRTNLQHTWAQVEHDLGYKTEFGVPFAVKRSFSRIAGLLELADDEFVRTRDMMDEYSSMIRQQIMENRAGDLLLNSHSLNEFVKSNVQMQAYLSTISEKTGGELKYISPEAYVERLQWFGIKTVGDLEQMLERDSETAVRYAEEEISAAELDVVSSNAGLRYLCLAELMNGKFTHEQILAFMKIGYRDERVAKRMARILVKRMENRPESEE